MAAIIPTVLIALCWLTSIGTALSFVRHPHWAFRIWDFPRGQLAAVAATSAFLYLAFYHAGSWAENLMLLASALTVVWQAHKIRPYTRVATRQVEDADPAADLADAGANTITLLVSNVLMENEDHQALLDSIAANDPDVVLAVEVDDAWMAALAPLTARYPHQVRHPRNNYYGMVLFSRFELVMPEVKFLIQDDIPSIHTGIRLPGGVVVRLHGLHPRPPEPLRDQPSAPRDAELVVMGRWIGDHGEHPTIVAGDLNDVAWSATSELFLRLSGLLDPRVGRGFYNSFDATNPLMRYPLDHVFHSNDFKLVRLERLPAIGSDHFPILIALRYDAAAPSEQPETAEAPGDQAEADEKLEANREAVAQGGDKPNDA